MRSTKDSPTEKWGLNLHQYKYLWSKCTKHETIIKAWKKLRKGKTHRKEVIMIENDFWFFVCLMSDMLSNTKPGGDPDKAYHPTILAPKYIKEHNKVRKIYRPPIWDQWVHHVIIMVLAPIIEKFSYKYSCGSMPNRGGVYGKKHLAKVVKKKGFKYFAKLDIRHFFDNIRLSVVIHELKVFIEDDWFIYLIEVVYAQFERGLPLGFYISQWLANFVLCRLDWSIVRRKHRVYLRYVDDMVIGDNNKHYIQETVDRIKKLLGRLKLRLKGNWQVIRFMHTFKSRRYKHRKPIGRPIDFMGFVFTDHHVILRKGILLRSTRMARRMSKIIFIAIRQAAGMLSRLGWYKHTHTKFTYVTRIQPCISVKALKGMVSKNEKRRNAHANRVDRGTFIYAAA